MARLTIEPRVAVIVENEISYLSIDVPGGSIVFWGKGFNDTHGFAILDRLQTWLPQTRSVLMDREPSSPIVTDG